MYTVQMSTERASRVNIVRFDAVDKDARFA
jgi:hypothetical protein